MRSFCSPVGTARSWPVRRCATSGSAEAGRSTLSRSEWRRRQSSRRRLERGAATRLDSHESCVGDVALRGKEAWVAGLELHYLDAVGPQDRHLVRADDPVLEDAVAEGRVRDVEGYGVAAQEPLDVGERREVGRAMAGDVDQLPLARHVGPSIAARPLRE